MMVVRRFETNDIVAANFSVFGHHHRHRLMWIPKRVFPGVQPENSDEDVHLMPNMSDEFSAMLQAHRSRLGSQWQDMHGGSLSQSSFNAAVGAALTCWTVEVLQTPLDMEAGASSAVCHPIEVTSEDEVPESVHSSASETETVLHESWLDAHAQVLTDRQLMESMKQEVEEFLAAGAGFCFQRTEHGLRCPFCPWHCFTRPQKVLQHVRRHHRSQKQCACSGTKQLKLILALRDADVIASVHKQG